MSGPTAGRSGRSNLRSLLRGAWAPVLRNPVEFISKLQIIDKTGKRVVLTPNDEQMEIIEALAGDDDTLIMKGRQIGSSTIICAWMFWKAYTSTEPLTLATMSHKSGSARHLLSIIKRMHDNLPIGLQRPISVDHGTEFRFADTGSGIIAVSAEGKGGLRSFSCNALHISEFAFADKPDELKATAISALNGGKLIIESTANRWGDGLHKEWMRSERGEADWNRIFFPWYTHKEYTIAVPLDEAGEPVELSWRDDELRLQEQFELTEGQLLWRRKTIGKLGVEKFRREYPSTVDEAYLVSGATYFQEEDFDNVEIIEIDNSHWTVFEEPQESDAYAIGVDVSAGVGKDYSVIYVLSKLTNSPVAFWRSNTTEPTALAEQIIDIATDYNDAMVLVESNNFGGIVLNQMRHEGYSRLWKQPDGRDFITSAKSKAAAFELLKKQIKSGACRHLDKLVYDELRTITVNERGTIELAPADSEGHSDSAMALCLAFTALERVQLPQVFVMPDWIKSKRINKIINNYGAACGPTRRY